jgi:hypothetical protein
MSSGYHRTCRVITSIIIISTNVSSGSELSRPPAKKNPYPSIDPPNPPNHRSPLSTLPKQPREPNIICLYPCPFRLTDILTPSPLLIIILLHLGSPPVRPVQLLHLSLPLHCYEPVMLSLTPSTPALLGEGNPVRHSIVVAATAAGALGAPAAPAADFAVGKGNVDVVVVVVWRG